MSGEKRPTLKPAGWEERRDPEREWMAIQLFFLGNGWALFSGYLFKHYLLPGTDLPEWVPVTVALTALIPCIPVVRFFFIRVQTRLSEWRYSRWPNWSCSPKITTI